MKNKEAFCPFVILRQPFPSSPRNSITSFWKTFDTLINENAKKRGREWKPKYEFCQNLWENHEHNKKKTQETGESRHSTTQGDDDPGDSML